MTIESPGDFWKDYELIDSGNFEKLERFGNFIMARPEPKALWDKSMSDGEWNKLIHTRFRTGAGFGKAGKEDSGTWERHKKMDDQWYIRYTGARKGLGFSLRLGLTSFKHVGVFPEQSPNWEYIYAERKVLSEAVFKNQFAVVQGFECGLCAECLPDRSFPEDGGISVGV